jgi:DNA-directed RNA polymerase specialized sigma subunit
VDAHEAFERLSPLERQIIDERLYEHLSWPKIGERHGLTRQSAYRLWQQAIKRMEVMINGPSNDQG